MAHQLSSKSAPGIFRINVLQSIPTWTTEQEDIQVKVPMPAASEFTKFTTGFHCILVGIKTL